MERRITGLVKARPVLAFSLLAFGASWLLWLPNVAHSYGRFPFTSSVLGPLAGLAPGVAAFVVTRILRGEAGDHELLGPLLRWRVGLAVVLALVLGRATRSWPGPAGAGRPRTMSA